MVELEQTVFKTEEINQVLVASIIISNDLKFVWMRKVI